MLRVAAVDRDEQRHLWVYRSAAATITRRNLFTAVQTNSKSTVFVFKFEFYCRLSCMVIQNTKQSGLAENNNTNKKLLEIFIQIQHVVNMWFFLF